MKNIYNHILKSKKRNKKLFAVLIDPDKFNLEVIREANRCDVDIILIGGSKIKKGKFISCVNAIKKSSKIPLVIFPGGKDQISNKANAILLLSLISGRNPDFLIGEHIKAAQQLRQSKLQIIPTGYLLIGGGKMISTQKVSKTSPIKHSDISLAVSTSIAGEMLGMKMIYLEAGSGAKKTLTSKMISEVKKNISIPLITGGGINSPALATAHCKAGADIIVVGNAIEKDFRLIEQISRTVHAL